MLTFTAIDDAPGIFGAKTTISLPWFGGERAQPVNFRIDGRPPGIFRVDMRDVAMWVAIDGSGSELPATFELAVALANRYAQAMRDQKTWSPTLS